ncbi:MAG TPA: acyl-CoA dehydrogenase family protein [Acidimicrobiales bacterium]|nr:acyl-CoA dehydrogenase family protein [Acidimicrobiales bacterium]
MDFTFSAEQDALRDVAKSFLAAEAPATYVRSMIDDAGGVTDALWAKVVELGWTGLFVPEANGGSGLGMLEAVVVAEEMGKLPLPGPWLSSSVAATLTALRLGDTKVLDDLAAGRRRGTLAVEETGARDPLDAIGVTARQSADGWVLDGEKPLVLDGHTADFAYVVARTEDDGRVATFAVDDPAGQPVPNLDVTRKIARISLDGRAARHVGPDGDQRALLSRVIDDVGIALCAESVGACDRALVMATDYAKVRVQFDRPIATFQAIRHKIVDMLHQLELARVATHYAAWASDAVGTGDVDDAARQAAAASCKGFVGEAAAMITGENIQVHGGVGFTWDVDAHLLFRRVKANDVLFGRQGWQRQRLADLVLDGAV